MERSCSSCFGTGVVEPFGGCEDSWMPCSRCAGLLLADRSLTVGLCNYDYCSWRENPFDGSEEEYAIRRYEGAHGDWIDVAMHPKCYIHHADNNLWLDDIFKGKMNDLAELG